MERLRFPPLSSYKKGKPIKNYSQVKIKKRETPMHNIKRKKNFFLFRYIKMGKWVNIYKKKEILTWLRMQRKRERSRNSHISIHREEYTANKDSCRVLFCFHFQFFYALTAYILCGKCVSFFFCFSVFCEASCWLRRLRIARVFLGRRSSGMYFFFE